MLDLHSFPTRRSSDLAIATLRYMPKKGAQLVRKVLESAVANAEHNHGADIDELKVALIHVDERHLQLVDVGAVVDRKSTRLNSSHVSISYAVFCLKKK